VPELVGLSTVQAELVLAEAGLGRMEQLAVPHPTAPPGQVLAQSPLPRQQLRPGAGVRVSVSSGPVQVRVPDLLGQPVERAEESLRRLGFTMDRVEGESPVAAGRVFELAPAPGTTLTLPAHVTVHVSLGPPPGDSLAADSLPASLPDSLPEVR
jgi:serine/threonine-protein kinase